MWNMFEANNKENRANTSKNQRPSDISRGYRKHRSDVFIVNFEHISHLFLFLLLNLSMYLFTVKFFHKVY